MTHLLRWLVAQRSSARLAFTLRTMTLVASSALSLIWARLLIRSMGAELYGLFLTFQAVVQLGGLGDLGLSGGMGVLLAGLLHERDRERCEQFMSNARGVYLVLAGLMLLLTAGLAPWWPRLVHLEPTSGSGSLTLLFVVGGLGLSCALLGGFFDNINYVTGTIVWPLLPSFFVTQAAVAAQVLLARSAAPLWIQYIPYATAAAVSLLLNWCYLRKGHPFLWRLFPIAFRLPEALQLSSVSLWAYLGAISNLIYLTTDRLIINGAFGAQAVPSFRFNNRLCELALSILASATFFALPGIVSRLLAPDGASRQQAAASVSRLHQLQVFLGCLCALGYLALNDRFIRLWMGPLAAAFQASLALELAFALNLAFSLAGALAVCLLGRIDPRGLRRGTLVIVLGGVINVLLSLWAARAGSIFGIAAATAIAQGVVNLIMSILTSRRLGQPVLRWCLETTVLPAAVCGAGALSLYQLRGHGWPGELSTLAIMAVALWVVARLVGLSAQTVRSEWQKLREIFPARRRRAAV